MSGKVSRANFESKETPHTKLFPKCLYDEEKKRNAQYDEKRKTFIFEKKGKKAHVLLSGTKCLSRRCDVQVEKNTKKAARSCDSMV
jgi:hypothetical protein